MDAKVAKMNCRRRTDKHVQFCSKCEPGYKCKVCDETFRKVKLHTTTFHQLKTDISVYAVDKSNDMITDIGCPRSVIGRKDLDRFIGSLSKHQQDKLEIQEVDENFKFGPSGPYRCFRKIIFPIATTSNQLAAEVAIVEADIPMLLGNNILKPLEAEIRLFSSKNGGNGVLKLKDTEIRMKETSGGHYTIRVADLGSLCDRICVSSQSFN